MNKILICTHNQGKFIEISTLLKDLSAEIVSLKDVGIDFDVEETGKTYEENAILKAKTYGEKAGLIALADDTGLEVEALKGKPGVHSNRFFSSNGEQRNRELNQLIGSNPNRSAKFVACVAFYNPTTKEVKTFNGEITGQILKEPKGDAHKSLGYDSIFFINELRKTFGEASLEEKNKISHRALAVIRAKSFLTKLL